MQAYYLTWHLKSSEYQGLAKFSECWAIPLISACAFFMYKQIAVKMAAPFIAPYCKD